MSKNKHPHADLIKAWADDTSIEFEWRPKGLKCNDGWENCPNPYWHTNIEYRIKEKPPEPFTLDWSVFHKRFKYAAIDCDEEIRVLEREPKYTKGFWYSRSADINDGFRIDHLLTCYTRGTVKPADSLIKRPDDE